MFTAPFLSEQLVGVLLAICWGSALSVSAQNLTKADSLEQIIATITDERARAFAHIDVGFATYIQDSVRSVNHSQQALRIGKKLADNALIGESYKNFALVEKVLKHRQRALTYYDSAYYYFQMAQDTFGLNSTLNSRGQVHCALGNCEQGLLDYYEALERTRTENDLYQKLRINQAHCLQQCDAHLDCIKICEETLPVALASNNRANATYLYMLLGTSYTELGRHEESLTAFNAALEVVPAERRGVYEGMILSDRAHPLIELGRYEQAYTELLQSIEVNAANNVRNHDTPTFILLGEVTKQLKRYHESVDWFEKGLHAMRKNRDNPQLTAAYVASAAAYESAGQDRAAYRQLLMAYQLRDSVFTEEMRENVQELNVKYETERVKKELAQSTLQVTLEQNQRRLTLFVSLGVLFFAISLSTLLFSRQRQQRLRVEKRRVELEYGLLRAQMNPHFVFNSLNSIQGYFANSDFKAGNQFLGKFSRLIRRVLDQSASQEVSLAEEIETLQLYLDLEALRLKNRLDYEFHYPPDLEIDLITVPPLILQPFVENAIWHGIAPKAGRGKIDVFLTTNQREDRLLAVIEDDGVGLTQKKQTHQSRGIQITRERLGAQSSVTITNRTEGSGVRVALEFPIGLE